MRSKIFPTVWYSYREKSKLSRIGPWQNPDLDTKTGLLRSRSET